MMRPKQPAWQPIYFITIYWMVIWLNGAEVRLYSVCVTTMWAVNWDDPICSRLHYTRVTRGIIINTAYARHFYLKMKCLGRVIFGKFLWSDLVLFMNHNCMTKTKVKKFYWKTAISFLTLIGFGVKMDRPSNIKWDQYGPIWLSLDCRMNLPACWQQTTMLW